MPSLPVPHYLPEFAQAHVQWVGDAIQPSHPLPPSSPLPAIFPRIRVFSNESSVCIRWPRYWSFSFSISPSNKYSGLTSFKIDWFRFDAGYWMLGAGALWRPRGMVWGGRREEGSGWGTHVYLWRIHFNIWQNQYNIVKFKNKIKLKKKIGLFSWFY